MFNIFKRRSKIFSTDMPVVNEKPVKSKSEPELPATQSNFSSVVKASMAAGTLLLLAAITTSGYLYAQVRELKKSPTAAADQEAQAIITAVGKHIVLPGNETPSIVKVADPSKLKDQPFFANASVGDSVLVYTNANKAILYSPSMDKIVEVAPLKAPTDIQPQVSGSSTTASPTKTKK